ncbi:hypothetical protein ACHABX_02670 [Nesterenkonia halotolerans]|uniref:hypothetical protein n=1 Tax=Nesterenkonia halotolerans TaxID=225325 RepID=UPI003EE81610
MSFDMLASARELLDDLAAHAAGGGLPADAALFTLDVNEAANALDAGRSIVTVGPPDAALPTSAAVDVTWTVMVAAGPYHDYLRGWAALDKVAGAIISPPTDVENVRAISWQPLQGSRAYPAYQLTITTAEDL